MAGSKGSKYYDIFLQYSISLEHKELGEILDSFRFKLLHSVHKTGSLKAASTALEISYRKAWGNVEDMEHKLGFKLLERQRGGKYGGKTSLTDDGLKLIDAHDSLRKEFDESIKTITKKFFHNLNL